MTHSASTPMTNANAYRTNMRGLILLLLALIQAARRLSQRALHGPTTLQAHLQAFTRDIQMARPFRDAHLHASELNKRLSARVIRLLDACRPSAILGCVMAVHIDAIQRASSRTATKVGEERVKRFAPSITDGDATPAVVLIGGLLRVIAAGLHRAPRTIFAGGWALLQTGAGLTMRQQLLRSLASALASATGDEAADQITARRDRVAAAVAATVPTCARRLQRAIARRSAHGRQHAESLIRQIQRIQPSRHMSYFTAGCAIAVAISATPASAQQYTITPTPFQVALDNSGKIINGSCVWTYVSGTTTPVTTYADISGTPNANPIKADSAGRFTAFLVPGSSYKFVYENIPCSAASHGTTLRTADNIAAVPAGSVNIDITGTAGETINSGSAAYLSDGSGGNAAGSWYNTNTTNTYSSNLATTVAIATATVTSGNSCTCFRVIGRVTGLTGLTAGAPHYVTNSNGALTSTAPTNARYVGTADSTTTLDVNPNPAQAEILQRQIRINAATPYSWTFPAADATGYIASNGSGTLSMSAIPACLTSLPQGRLTATTGTAVTTADVTAAVSIFYTPYGGNCVPLFDGATWNNRTFTEITISVAACTANKPFDVFLVDAGVGLQPTAEQLVWTSTTARATALTLQDGRWVKTGATTRLYVGTYFCNSSGGQTDDTLAKRYIYNAYNRVPRPLRRLETTGSWTYTTATIRQANGSTLNQVELMVGLAEVDLELRLLAQSNNTNADILRDAGFGEDSTTTYMAQQSFASMKGSLAITNDFTHHAVLSYYPAVGRHTYSWNEMSTATGTTTWRGVIGAGSADQAQYGIQGSVSGF